VAQDFQGREKAAQGKGSRSLTLISRGRTPPTLATMILNPRWRQIRTGPITGPRRPSTQPGRGLSRLVTTSSRSGWRSSFETALHGIMRMSTRTHGVLLKIMSLLVAPSTGCSTPTRTAEVDGERWMTSSTSDKESRSPVTPRPRPKLDQFIREIDEVLEEYDHQLGSKQG
jgi:hypothetical protein